MDYEEIIRKAADKARDDIALAQEPGFIQTVAWFHYLGLLKHNKILPHRHHPDLEDVLKAGGDGTASPRGGDQVKLRIGVRPQKKMKYITDVDPGRLADLIIGS